MTTISGNYPRAEIDAASEEYPKCLLDLEHPPDRIYVLGNHGLLSSENVSIVGSRKATPYGMSCAKLAARYAVEYDLSVVSGAAMGCDQVAQTEALERGGTCVAVLGGGADVVYPASSRSMLQRTLESGGALVSLVPWGVSPNRFSFVKRNPIIAALSKALIICEAGMPSGTFSTAEAAEQANREILVFPGSFFSSGSRGSNYLISQGGSVQILWDEECLDIAFGRIYERLRLRHPPKAESRDKKPSGERQGDGRGNATSLLSSAVLDAVMACPETPGELAEGLRRPAADVLRALGELTSRGLVRRQHDGRYSPSHVAMLRR